LRFTQIQKSPSLETVAAWKPRHLAVRFTRKRLAKRRYRALEARAQEDNATVTNKRMQTRPEGVVRQQALSAVPLRGAHRTSDESRSKTSSDFESRFTKNRKLIAFVARRVLECHKEAEAAVRECFKTASHNPPVFANDGAFRSWILRMVIDEALLILSHKKDGVSTTLRPQHLPDHIAPQRVLTE
jgi:Sigma-70 region 2